MEGTNRLAELREYGRMEWLDGARGWRAEPEDVAEALAADGFQECKRETARVPRAPAAGGVWQGIDKTGVVASTVWTREAGGASVVFITINGQPLLGE
jgi:hypothetical protein